MDPHSHLRATLLRPFALLLALAWAGTAWGQVVLDARSAHLTSGEATELGFRLEPGNHRRWRFSVDEPEGGSMALTRGGAVFYRAPTVAAPRSFTLRLTDLTNPGVTAVKVVTVVPRDRTPSSASSSSPQEPLPTSGQATLLFDWDALEGASGALETWRRRWLGLCLCYLARDLGYPRQGKMLILRDSGRTREATAAERDQHAKALAGFARNFREEVFTSRPEDLAGAGGPGRDAQVLERLRNREGLLLVATTRPEAFIPWLQSLPQDVHKPVVIVDVRAGGHGFTSSGSPEPPGAETFHAFARAWQGQLQAPGPGGSPLLPLWFQLEELPFWSQAGPGDPARTSLFRGQRLLTLRGQTGADHPWGPLAETYLRGQDDWVPWSEEATLQEQAPPNPFVLPAPPGLAKPYRARIYVDWQDFKVPMAYFGNFLAGVKAMVIAGHGGAVPQSWAITFYTLKVSENYLPGPVLGQLEAEGRVEGLACHKAEEVKFKLIHDLNTEPEPETAAQGADVVCLVAGDQTYLPSINLLAMRGHETYGVSLTPMPHYRGLYTRLSSPNEINQMEAYVEYRKNRRLYREEVRAAAPPSSLKRTDLVAMEGWNGLHPEGVTVLEQGRLLAFYSGNRIFTYVPAKKQRVELTGEPRLEGEAPKPRPADVVSLTSDGEHLLYASRGGGAIERIDLRNGGTRSELKVIPANQGMSHLYLDPQNRLWFTLQGAPARIGFLDLDRPEQEGAYRCFLAPVAAQVGLPGDKGTDGQDGLVYGDASLQRFVHLQVRFDPGAAEPTWTLSTLYPWPAREGEAPPSYEYIFLDRDGSFVFLDRGRRRLVRLSPRALTVEEPPQPGPWIRTDLEGSSACLGEGTAAGGLALDPVRGDYYGSDGSSLYRLTFAEEPPKQGADRPPMTKQGVKRQKAVKSVPCRWFALGKCAHQYHPQDCPFLHLRPHPAPVPASARAARQADPAAAQGHAGPEQVEVFLDFQNVKVAKTSIPTFLDAIKAFATGHRATSGTCQYACHVYLAGTPKTADLQDAFARLGCEVKLSPTSKKGACDYQIVQDLLDFEQPLSTGALPATVCLVSGDGSFRDPMERVHKAGHRVLLVHNAQAPGDLVKASWWDGTSLYTELPGLETYLDLLRQRKLERVEAWRTAAAVVQVGEVRPSLGRVTAPSGPEGGMAWDSAGGLLLGSGSLIQRYDRDRNLLIDLPPIRWPEGSAGAPPMALKELAVTPSGTIWVRTASGRLGFLDPKDPGAFVPALGLRAPAGPGEPLVQVHGLGLDRDLRLWFTFGLDPALGYLNLAAPREDGGFPLVVAPAGLLVRPTAKGMDEQGALLVWDQGTQRVVRVRHGQAWQVDTVYQWPSSGVGHLDLDGLLAVGNGHLILHDGASGRFHLVRGVLGAAPTQEPLAPGTFYVEHRERAVPPFHGSDLGRAFLKPVKKRLLGGPLLDDRWPSLLLYTPKGLARLYRSTGEAPWSGGESREPAAAPVSGIGHWLFPNGERYEGGFQGRRAQGPGVRWAGSGRTLVSAGVWEQGELKRMAPVPRSALPADNLLSQRLATLLPRTGDFDLLYPDGSFYVGAVNAEGEAHGQGVLYDLEGRVLNPGPFEHGQPRPAPAEAGLSLEHGQPRPAPAEAGLSLERELAELGRQLAEKQKQLRMLRSGAAVQPPSSAAAQPLIGGTKNKAACSFFNRGSCTMGKDCTHLHVCWYCRDDAHNDHAWIACPHNKAQLPSAIPTETMLVWSCALCNVSFNSLQQQAQHEAGRAHQARVAKALLEPDAIPPKEPTPVPPLHASAVPPASALPTPAPPPASALPTPAPSQPPLAQPEVVDPLQALKRQVGPTVLARLESMSPEAQRKLVVDLERWKRKEPLGKDGGPIDLNKRVMRLISIQEQKQKEAGHAGPGPLFSAPTPSMPSGQASSSTPPPAWAGSPTSPGIPQASLGVQCLMGLGIIFWPQWDQRYWSSGGQPNVGSGSVLAQGLTREAFKELVVAGLLKLCATGDFEHALQWGPGQTRPTAFLRLGSRLGFCMGPLGLVETNCVVVEVASHFDPTTRRVQHQVTDVRLTAP